MFTRFTSLRFVATSFLLSGVLSSCFINIGPFDYIQGSGNITTQKRELPTFTSVENTTAADVEITTKSSQNVELTTDDNIHEYFITQVRDNALRITTQGGRVNVRQARFKISMQTLQSIENIGQGEVTASPIETASFQVMVMGSGNVKADNIKTESIRVETSGSGGATLQNITTDMITAKISGSGGILLQGTGRSGTLQTLASGGISARDFTLQDAVAQAYGSGNIRISVVQSLNATVSGSGGITYYGNPTVQSSVTGSGRVNRGN